MNDIVLKNNTIATIRLLTKDDAGLLLEYLERLSAESRSRFGPHSFDRDTVTNICNNLNPDDVQRFVIVVNNHVVAYMLIKKGMLDADAERYSQRNLFFDAATTVTFAPSVADDFQNTGLGSEMFAIIVAQLKKVGCLTIVLWGGVQATNARAVHFYKKHGFESEGNFWHNDKDNIDMLMNL